MASCVGIPLEHAANLGFLDDRPANHRWPAPADDDVAGAPRGKSRFLLAHDGMGYVTLSSTVTSTIGSNQFQLKYLPMR